MTEVIALGSEFRTSRCAGARREEACGGNFYVDAAGSFVYTLFRRRAAPTMGLTGPEDAYRLNPSLEMRRKAGAPCPAFRFPHLSRDATVPRTPGKSMTWKLRRKAHRGASVAFPQGIPGSGEPDGGVFLFGPIRFLRGNPRAGGVQR